VAVRSLASKLSSLEKAGRMPLAPGFSAPPLPAPPPSPPSGAPRASLLDDLRARMQATLERSARKLPAPPPAVDTCELPFVTFETPSGSLHVRMQRLSGAHRTGHAPVACARDASPALLALLALDPALAACEPSRALYLDTETTGLSGGAGTVAFLVGLAWWDGPTLVLEQILVRALGEEAPMLERVRDRIEAASMLVTFNGKSFDMPLLRTRFVMARVTAPAEPPHLDLLHVARRVHKERTRRSAGACKLTALERDILGFERIDDVASGDVSACYLHFLRTGDARALLGVIEHNAWDVVAMAALVGLYGESLPVHSRLVAEDLAGLARTLRRAGALDHAMAAAEAALDRVRAAPPSTSSGDAGHLPLRVRAEIAKARGDRAQALADFEALATAVDDPAARLELAKIYEHWVRAPAEALAWAARGTGETPERAEKRSRRLTAKAAKAAGAAASTTAEPLGQPSGQESLNLRPPRATRANPPGS
jgi:uncharacterized protein YprB with RNaseH-like and TPR domain